MKKANPQTRAAQHLLRMAAERFDLAKNAGFMTIAKAASGLDIRSKKEAYKWALASFAARPVTRKIERQKFYTSIPWRRVRHDALLASNGCCVLCGRSQRLHGVVLHVDHIKPISKRPELCLEPTNLQVFCDDCNLGKSNRDDTDWRKTA